MKPHVFRLLFIVLCSIFLSNGVVSAQSTIRTDERILFFPTAAALNEGEWEIPVHGWIFEPEDSSVRRRAIAYALSSRYGLNVTAQSEPMFRSRINWLLADNERGKRVRIRIAGTEYTLPASEKNGHFSALLRLPVAAVAKAAQGDVLPYEAVLSDGDTRRFEGRIFLYPPHGLSVISDIDDTIKISVVQDRRELLERTLYRDFAVVEGMPQYFRALAANRKAVFHFVSSSPWHLFEPLESFVQEHRFPPAVFHLKSFRFKDTTLLNLFQGGMQAKMKPIREILERFPQRSFLLVGDSGEEDPELYGTIMREFPHRISLCLIRNVTGATRDDSRFGLAFRGVPAEKWRLFSSADELS